MGSVHPLWEHRRELITDGARSRLRATWHMESGLVVISLWRGETCVATSHLTPEEAGRLSSFITDGLAELAEGKAQRPRRYQQGGSVRVSAMVGTLRAWVRRLRSRLPLSLRQSE